jgi:hypothetical protein
MVDFEYNVTSDSKISQRNKNKSSFHHDPD